ncbi:MAG TPA: flagellar motor protein MotA [Xanthomonadaceae bacterium]|nr:flagellar motor protein MotA [Xanthomonadaceae bacterium]
MSQPTRVLVWMLGALAAVALLALVLIEPLIAAFRATPVFNAVILGVFAVGVLVNLRQVLRLQSEVRWIESFRRSNPARAPAGQPRLLRPMASMLAGRERGPRSLSTASTRSILDSIYLRLEESRDLSRYLIGLLIFLGLLGTFWGLLRTIGSVSGIIAGLSGGADAMALFENLKTQLQAPLSGMATSFSTSLFGLAGSLVVGFLDLMAGHAANRFYQEVEEWLSGMTRLSSGGLAGEGEASVPAYVQALLEQTADGLERMQRAFVDAERERRAGAEQLGELNAQLSKLGELLARESRGLGQLADSQEELRSAVRALVQAQTQAPLAEELRAELRLLARTIAAALDGKRGGSGPD